jgi:hypothetical protein
VDAVSSSSSTTARQVAVVAMLRVRSSCTVRRVVMLSAGVGCSAANWPWHGAAHWQRHSRNSSSASSRRRKNMHGSTHSACIRCAHILLSVAHSCCLSRRATGMPFAALGRAAQGRAQWSTVRRNGSDCTAGGGRGAGDAFRRGMCAVRVLPRTRSAQEQARRQARRRGPRVRHPKTRRCRRLRFANRAVGPPGRRISTFGMRQKERMN